MSFDPADLAVVSSYFEEMIGCVAGCGCWEPDWDNEERVAKLLASTAPSPYDRDQLFGNTVLEALERLFASLDPSDMTAVNARLDLHFEHVGDFRDFFDDSVANLRAALGGASA